jgi:hypothetical protein
MTTNESTLLMKWCNPTGGQVRATDRWGAGNFGASRGDRKHTGTDYCGVPGQAVCFVCDGVIEKNGYVYPDDLSYRYVAIRTNRGHLVRHLYVEPGPLTRVGRTVTAGEHAGILQALHPRYENITNHVHVDVLIDGEYLNPEEIIP